jgi:hypothetical protein
MRSSFFGLRKEQSHAAIRQAFLLLTALNLCRSAEAVNGVAGGTEFRFFIAPFK